MRHHLRRRGASAGLLLAAALLTGCGGGDSSAYCDAVASAQDSLGGIDETTDFADLERAIGELRDLADQAPTEVEDDWAVLTGALTDLTDALDRAGVTFDDLGSLAEGQMPENLDLDKLTQLGEDLQGLGAAEVQEASNAITRHAEEECGLDFQSG